MTAQPDHGPAFEDLTARARIRDAALRLFTERGVDGATIRDIAKAAGVSGGLVRHHFGSKEALREACDSYALKELMRIKEQAIFQDRISDAGFFTSVHPKVLSLNRYLVRALLDGSPAAAAMFDDMVDLTQQWLADHPQPGHVTDPRAFAAVFVAMQTGMYAMHEHLSRVLGAEVFSPEGYPRMARGMLDFYTNSIVDPDLAAKAYAALDRVQQPPTPAEPDSASEGALR